MARICQRDITPSKAKIFFGSLGRVHKKRTLVNQKNLENTIQDRRSESGVSLLISLLFVGLIASLLTQFVIQENEISARSNAAAAGWQLAEVARAARVYVRNNSFTVDPVINGVTDGIADNTFDKNNLAVGAGPFVPNPVAITIAELEAAGLLPENFATLNAFRQTIEIYAANFPLDGDPTDPATVATAYVFLDNDGRGSATLNARIAEQAQKFGMQVSAPLFNAAANISDPCGVTPAASTWDTNCLTEAQFTSVTGQAFAAGMLMAPAWKAYQHDPRTIARFPQPENVGAGTMLTNLNMGRLDLDAANACQNEVHVWDGANYAALSYDDTGICAAQDDVVTGGAVDNRFDILNIPSLNVQTAVLQAQSEDFFDNLAPLNGSIYDTSGTAGDRSSETDDNTMMDEGDPTRDNSIQSLAAVPTPHLNQVLTLEGTITTKTLSTLANASNDAAGAPLYTAGAGVGFINNTGGSGAAGDNYLSTFHVNGDLNVDHGVRLNGPGNLDMVVRGTALSDIASADTVRNNGAGASPTASVLVERFLTTDDLDVDNNAGSRSVVGGTGVPVNRGVVADLFTANINLGAGVILADNFDVVGEAALITDLTAAATSAGGFGGTGNPHVVVGAATAESGVNATTLTIGDSSNQGNLIVDNSLDIISTGGTTVINECNAVGQNCPDMTLDPIAN